MACSDAPYREANGSMTGLQDVPLIESTRLNVVLAVVYVVSAGAYLISAEGLLDYSGHLVGRDFANFWTAGGSPPDPCGRRV